MTSNQTASDLGEAPSEEEDPFQFEYTLEGAPSPIHLRRPTDAQVAVLVRLDSMLEDAPVSGVQLYMDALGALMDDEDEQKCLRWLLRGKIQLEAFADLARQTLLHYYPELAKKAEEAEKTSRSHGPAAQRRPRRR